jgi:hypothetical protein
MYPPPPPPLLAAVWSFRMWKGLPQERKGEPGSIVSCSSCFFVLWKCFAVLRCSPAYANRSKPCFLFRVSCSSCFLSYKMFCGFALLTCVSQWEQALSPVFKSRAYKLVGYLLGWIRNFAIRNFAKFRTQKLFRISRNFYFISRNFAKFRDRISRNFAK